ncbi:hypothetical protein [Clostridium sp. DL1XJH146]
MKNNKSIKKIILIVVVVIFLIPISTILLARPTEKLDLDYTSINLEQKMSDEVLEFNGNISLGEDDLTNILKENVVQEAGEALDYITGIDLNIENDKIEFYANIQYSIFKVGFKGVASIEVVEDNLIITPSKFYLGRLSISPDKVYGILDNFNIDTSQMINEDGKFIMHLSELANAETSSLIDITNISLEDDSLNIFFDIPNEVVTEAVSTSLDIATQDDRIEDTTRIEIANSINKHCNNTISNKTIEDLSKGEITEQSKNEILDSIDTMTAKEQTALLKEVSALVDPEVLNDYLGN